MDSILADDIADAALHAARGRYRTWRDTLEQATPDEVVELEAGGDQVWGVRLADTAHQSLAYSGWISSRVKEWQRTAPSGANVGVLMGDDFMSLKQLSLAHAAPYFVAQGPEARDALEAVCAAERSFDPAAFDSDGYLR